MSLGRPSAVSDLPNPFPVPVQQNMTIPTFFQQIQQPFIPQFHQIQSAGAPPPPPLLPSLLPTFFNLPSLSSLIRPSLPPLSSLPPLPPFKIELLDIPPISLPPISFDMYVLVDIPEDSIYRKLLACIPFIGIIPTITNERSLRRKITATPYASSLARLIHVKNHYKISSIIREMLTIALVIAKLARPILGPTEVGVVVASGAIGGAFVASYAYGIYKNRQLIRELEANHALPSDFYLR